ncbi:hypothetical protein [Hoeflea sp.]|uniref:hypothetical protein n=1 Tax=Hoeflea sp. TaxID=1940281 RepID=UPI003749CFE1
MTDYLLEIQIDQAGVQAIAGSGMSIAILLPQQNAAYQIVAVLTSATNTIHVEWTDALSVYVSQYSLTAYSVPMINNSSAALSGQVFTYNSTTITQTGSTSLADTVQLSNASGGTITSGLARVYTINGQTQDLAITSAASLLNSVLGSFTISGQLLLTLLGGAQAGMALPTQTIPSFGTVQKRSIPQVAVAQPLLLDFTASNNSQTVHFNDQSNTFIKGGLP